MRIARFLAAPCVTLTIAAGAGHAIAVDVTACGQVVHGTGVLVGDLDCSAHVGLRSVQLIGTLRLNGYSITGNPGGAVVYCNTGPCRIEGPGRLTGGGIGLRTDVGTRINDTTIDLNQGDGILAQRNVRALGAMVVTANGGDGIRSNRAISVLGGKEPATDAVVSGNGGDGISTLRTVRLQDTHVDANDGNGIQAGGAVSLVAAAVQANGIDGARALRVRLRDAVATGNGTDAACGVSESCADVASAMKPALLGASTCEVSRKLDGSGSWGVCTLD